VKRALVFGSAGQDGRILTQQLLSRGVAVAGIDRGLATLHGGALPQTDVLKPAELDRLLGAFVPDAVFYLAAFHHSSQDNFESNLGELFRLSFSIHVDGWVNVLEALRKHAPAAHVFYAASSHVFGIPPTPVQNELTPFAPDNAYGITKAAGVETARFFRARGQHVSCGILYNHESAFRLPQFVSQRIVQGAIAAAEAKRKGEPFTLELGSFSAIVDWGYAPDYTDAMTRIVGHEAPGDYVVATGVPHTVADFCAAAFQAVGLDWRAHVTERAGRVTKQLAPLVGDASRLRQTTGWAPTVPFEKMVPLLVEAARPGASQ
jgi:GDPmannose 4,6-dehydratase